MKSEIMILELTSLLAELSDHHRSTRVAFRRLDNKSVASDCGHRNGPERDHTDTISNTYSHTVID